MALNGATTDKAEYLKLIRETHIPFVTTQARQCAADVGSTSAEIPNWPAGRPDPDDYARRSTKVSGDILRSTLVVGPEGGMTQLTQDIDLAVETLWGGATTKPWRRSTTTPERPTRLSVGMRSPIGSSKSGTVPSCMENIPASAIYSRSS
jgi:hypothetical protein